MTSVCFTVEGDWLCDFARTRVLEQRWDHAVKVLETLQGITIDQILKVLKGDAKLVGDSNVGIDLKPDDDAAYKAQLAYMFGGVWNNQGRYMRPYALVTSWGPDDMVEAAGRKYRWKHSSMFYADHPSDQMLNLKCENDIFDRGDVLWREVRGFPHLIVDAYSNMDPQAALDAYVEAGCKLEERGYLGGRYWAKQLDDILTRTGAEEPPANVPGDPETLYEAKENMRRGSTPSTTIDPPRSALAAAMDKMFPEAPTDDQIKKWTMEIVKQADGQWLELTPEVSVPRAPFENWCLWRGDGAHLAMPWKTVCPSGLKMGGDDPYHTDFMVGAGLDLAYDHDSDLHKAIWDMRQKVQEEKLGFKCAVLCGTGVSAELKVVHPKRGQKCQPDEVAVIPNAGPSYVAAASTAGAVITEVGGAMAHLVTVSREQDVKIVRVENARKLYPEGMRLVVDCKAGDVHVPRSRVDYKMKLFGAVIDVDTLP